MADKIEAHLRQAESFPETNPNPVLEVGVDGRVHFINKAGRSQMPDLKERGAAHPFLVYWPEVKDSLEGADSKGILRRVQVEDKWYQQAIHALPDSDRIRVYAFDVTAEIISQEQKRREEQTTFKFQTVLMDLARAEVTDRSESLRRITKRVSEALGVDRVGVWLMNEKRSELICASLFVDSTGVHEQGRALITADYPRYFHSITESRILAVQDAWNDPRTSELAREMFIPANITSVVHVPIRHNRHLVGVLCHEHVGPKRKWKANERDFAASVADTISLTISTLERRKVEEERERLTKAVNQSSDWIYVVSRDGEIIYINESVCKTSGYSQEELIGNNPRLWKSGHHQEAFYQELWDTILTGDPFIAIFINKTKSGELFHLDQTITPIRDSEGEVVNFVGTGKDITEQKLMEEKINYLSYYDSLTELPNRNLFFDRLDQAIRTARQKDLQLAVLLLDLDNFKYVNDTQGSEVGDQVLIEVGARLDETVYERDTVSRFGNDEYGIIAEVDKIEDILPLIEKIRDNIMEPINGGDVNLSLTANIGISVFPDDGEETAELVKKADLSLAQAKTEGRNGYRFFTQDMDERISEFVLMEQKLNLAKERSEFVLYYQPYFDIMSGNLTGMESLLRWQSEDDGLVSPGKFIPVLEETRNIIPIGRWIIETVCKQLQDWSIANLEVVPVSINLSPIQFAQEDLLSVIEGIVSDYGANKSKIVFEITESTFMRDVDLTRETLQRLRDLGFSISIDDFGTGYSSLAYLLRFPLDNLKIDMSFIRDIDKDPADASLVRAIITLAHTLNLKTIAEGVETDEQLGILKNLRCDMAQGYVCAKPQPAEEVTTFLHGLAE